MKTIDELQKIIEGSQNIVFLTGMPHLFVQGDVEDVFNLLNQNNKNLTKQAFYLQKTFKKIKIIVRRKQKWQKQKKIISVLAEL